MFCGKKSVKTNPKALKSLQIIIELYIFQLTLCLWSEFFECFPESTGHILTASCQRVKPLQNQGTEVSWFPGTLACIGKEIAITCSLHLCKLPSLIPWIINMLLPCYTKCNLWSFCSEAWDEWMAPGVPWHPKFGAALAALWNCHNGPTVVWLTIRMVEFWFEFAFSEVCFNRLCRFCVKCSVKTWPTSGTSWCLFSLLLIFAVFRTLHLKTEGHGERE